MPLSAGTLLGPYEIVAPLGAGGMGEVYKARDTRLNRIVAIKILPADVAADPQRRERFRREARAISSLTHPHICTLHDVGEQDGIDFLVMEYVAGETLAHRLLRGALPVDEVLRIASELADALDGAHREGIVHRDLKPANVMLTAGSVKVLDFGLAKWHGAGPDALISAAQLTAPLTLTQVGAIVGTTQYMAPEQVEGKPVDARTDLFALGAIIYEMTTGRKAFEGTSSTTAMAAILTSMPPPMATLQPVTPSALDRIVRKCLAKDPAKRWQTAADLRDALAWIKDDVSAPVAPSTGAKTATLRKKRLLAVAVSIAVVALAAAAYVGTRWRPQSIASASPPSIEDLQVTQLTSTGNAEAPAVSSDGKYVVYVQHVGDAYSLWMRQIGTGSQVEIVPPEPNTQISGATVTPDGGFVDFVRGSGTASQGLWRVPFLGRTPKKLIDSVVSPVGWSPDGEHMAFLRVLDSASSALVIADGDGSHERIAAVRRIPAAFTHLARPAWSLDGRTVALLGSGTPGLIERRLVVVDVATGAERVLPLPIIYTGGQALVWLDEASLVVSRPSDSGAPTQLWRVSYPGGHVSRLTNDLSNYDRVSLTADRNSLVTGRSDVRVSVWVGEGSGTGFTEVVPPGPGSAYLRGIAWAGERLLYLTTASGRSAIASVTPGRGPSEEIVKAGFYPAATSDGRTIVFGSHASSELWKVDADGRHPVQLVSGLAFFPTVTRDDRRVIFASTRSGLQSLWTVSIDGGSPTELANMYAYYPDVSPDGKSLLFGATSTRGQLAICDLPACTARRTVTTLPGGAISRWTPDGRGIAYGDGIDGGTNLWVQPLDGSAPHQLTHFTDGRVIYDFAWSRDGKRLAIARATITNDIVLFRGLRR